MLPACAHEGVLQGPTSSNAIRLSKVCSALLAAVAQSSLSRRARAALRVVPFSRVVLSLCEHDRPPMELGCVPMCGLSRMSRFVCGLLADCSRLEYGGLVSQCNVILVRALMSRRGSYWPCVSGGRSCGDDQRPVVVDERMRVAEGGVMTQRSNSKSRESMRQHDRSHTDCARAYFLKPAARCEWSTDM